jgi:hypothetical protein
MPSRICRGSGTGARMSTALTAADSVASWPCLSSRAGPDRARRAGINQRQHRAEGRIGLAVPRGGGGEVEQLAVIGVDGADLLLTGRSECCELHLGTPCYRFKYMIR